MTEVTLKIIPVDDLSTLRLKCMKCANTAEMSLEKAAKDITKCPFCKQTFWGPQEASPLQQLKDGVQYLQLLSENDDLKVSFIVDVAGDE